VTFLISALGIASVFGVVIFVHEFGHFIVAKRLGVKVERFSFGLGPEAIGFQWGETRYCLAWIPLGGEVRMAGEMDGANGPLVDGQISDPRVKDPREFFAQAWYRRIWIALAGPAMNYLLAFVLFTFVFFLWGEPRVSLAPVVGEVLQRSPAQEAGIQAGDRFLSLEGTPVSSWEEVVTFIHGNPEKSLRVEMKRGETSWPLSLTPRLAPGTQIGLIGISPTLIYEKQGLGFALKQGAQRVVDLSLLTLRYLWGKMTSWEKPELSGPIGIAGVIAKATTAGAANFLSLMAILSLGIGLFNLFPIPLLDGGHIVFFLWEGIFRRPLSRRVMQMANTVGLSLLMGVLLFSTYNDIQGLRKSKTPTTQKP
jgi:regulator of sigma E protease